MKKILYMLLAVMSLTACKKEIGFDFNEIDPIVVIEGKVTNEGSTVVISRSRSVMTAERVHCLEGAIVTVTGNGTTTPLLYDAEKDCYYSELTGVPGVTYQLSVDFEGKHYEATSQMQAQAPILSYEFFWLRMMNERMLSFEMWAQDPDPNQRTYYWFRMLRKSSNPHFANSPQTEPYDWDSFDDRGCPPGKVFVDVVTVTEQQMKDDEEDYWRWILYDGDRITVELMTVDRTVHDYLCELKASQHGNGANPHSNITGGCLGYFVATSISRTETIVFDRNSLKDLE